MKKRSIVFYFHICSLFLLSGCVLKNFAAVDRDRIKDDFYVMIKIPAGEFLMGSKNDSSVVGYHPYESPQHKVFVDTFYIGKYETTNIQFKKFIDDRGYYKKEYWTEEGWAYRKKLNFELPSYWETGEYHSGPKYPDYPVNGISWYEAYAYAKWAEGRLPSEAEWEKAARGTDGRIWPWGDNPDMTRTNTWEAGIRGTAPVGSFPTGASPYGLLDIGGNVAEWINDLYAPYPSEKLKEPRPLDGIRRALRGACWKDNNYKARTAFRGVQFPTDRWRGKCMGVRIVKDPVAKTEKMDAKIGGYKS